MYHLPCYAITVIVVSLVMLPEISQPQNCGKRKIVNFLILNSAEAKDGYWPWHAALFHYKSRTSSYACGGTILDRNTILTAASCVMTPTGTIEPEGLIVQVGLNNLRLINKRFQHHEAFAFLVHPEYNVNSLQHNIALVQLATDITYTKYIQPICLWDQDLNMIVGSTGTVVGYGFDETDNPSDTLRETQLTVVDALTCIQSNRDVYGVHLTRDMFCAGSHDGGNPCNGDSGGGFFLNYNDVWYIRGVVSFMAQRENSSICNPKEYVVFTDVQKYLSWIKMNLRARNE